MEGDNQEDALTAYPFMMDPVKNIARTYKFSVPILLVFSGIAAMGFAEGQFINSCWGLEYKLDGYMVELVNNGEDDQNSWEYNIWESVQELWWFGDDHKATDLYIMAIILFTLSGIIPHVKLFLGLCNWIWPDISHERRIQRVLFLDNIGRWNHTDIIVVMLFVAMVRCSILVAGGSMAETYFDLYTYTVSGAYWYCLSVVASQLMGHVQVYVLRTEQHRLSSRTPKGTPRTWRPAQDTPQEMGPASTRRSSIDLVLPEDDMDRDPVAPPSSMVWSIREEMTALYGRYLDYVVAALMVLNVIMYITAITSVSYRVVFKVPVIELTNKSYSVLDTIFELMNSEPITQSDKYGIQFISQLVLVFVLYAPCIRLLVQAALWFSSLSTRSHAACETIHEVAMLWSCLDVSIFAGLLVVCECKSITQKILDCPEEQPDCFYIDIHPLYGFVLSAISCFISYGVNALLLFFIHRSKLQVNAASIRQPIVGDSLPSLVYSTYSAD
mmetsp:Transcript_26701/g.50801  ORF Transcript_26701/g.50801 Transcript_26701/m.50801 type:complete len:498 (-) Transcript_26701:198-1691(-)|eukprot:CAMPEP_0114256682 /NCGR_PEP_ID=MMETSP0058-20121206/18304_1 /TAXON_ID=36894 /ORGANISM="Pyramimonas parkeae, CCMP726" /LENGTH=497 /DNA_ID=CAMNT_0001371307 /DNA_START=292 /DNA_END=1785 /DNA_ORIENTATION=+